MHSARVIGMAEGVRETYLAISPERRAPGATFSRQLSSL